VRAVVELEAEAAGVWLRPVSTGRTDPSAWSCSGRVQADIVYSPN
jgi:hypothetical protein